MRPTQTSPAPRAPRRTRAVSTCALLALCATLLVGGCAEEAEPEPQVEAQPTLFEVTTSIEFDQSNFRDAVRVDSVYLGIGSVLLEPLDDLDAPLVSNRTPTPLRYDLSGELDGRADAAPLQQVAPGRYLLSLAIQPLDSALWEPTASRNDAAMRESSSVVMQGHYFVVDPPGISSPEPVPLRKRMMMATAGYDSFDFGRVHDYPFTYQSERTGYIRVGEVELSPEQNHIQIRINLEGWLDEALAPVLADAVSATTVNGSQQLDVSTRLESSGQGLERLFKFSVARSF